ncbi:DUF4209 domain-containing protein [Microbacterium sp. VKM Ac-2923]|uniref:DUF4209 domain-containing protein n=1 Tax=Microbacterium sp. VKM Ac-2923 TaxID=2929476 RepID=UPI001FB4208E|nr:DUF4209 domain-containing protein [Microbacterium sp. VKM Ac-2923]MCJ1709416.1 DUF4209 domain-containing protein [Microbacterium sp. VKM Ac-2923]
MNAERSERPNWAVVLQAPILREAFEGEPSGVTLLSFPLKEIAAGEENAQTKEGLEALSGIASLYVLPDDWNRGYGPMAQFGASRSFIPTDLSDKSLALLEDLVEHVPHDLLRARTYDVLALRVRGRKRMDHVRSHLNTLLRVGVDSESWFGERDMWHRAIETAKRFGKATSTELAGFERELLSNLLDEPVEDYFQAQLADALAKHGLGRSRANDIACRLRDIGDSFADDADKARIYYEGAGDWFGADGDMDARGAAYATVIQSFIAEAEALAKEKDGNLARAGYLLERALRDLQRIPRADRERLGLDDTASMLPRRIREIGVAGLGDMHRYESDPVDLSEAAQEARKQVSGLEPDKALLKFAMLEDFASFEKDQADTEDRLKRHPFAALFSLTTYSADGRVVQRSDGSGGTPVFGVDPAVWRQMVQAHVLRIQLLAAGRLWPAFETLTNEHHLSIGDFIAITAGSSTVPLDHIRQFARGLYYGYTGDFSTAAQLLTLQIEHFVRHHLQNAGVFTTTRTVEGIENEKGLSSLLESEKIDEIFGADLAYELRVLYLDATGPNLRNEVAHGLLTDATSEGAESLYAWWLALRIVLLQFWKRSHQSSDHTPTDDSTPADDDDGINPAS